MLDTKIGIAGTVVITTMVTVFVSILIIGTYKTLIYPENIRWLSWKELGVKKTTVAVTVTAITISITCDIAILFIMIARLFFR